MSSKDKTTMKKVRKKSENKLAKKSGNGRNRFWKKKIPDTVESVINQLTYWRGKVPKMPMHLKKNVRGWKRTCCRLGCNCTPFWLLPPWQNRGSSTCCIWSTSSAKVTLIGWYHILGAKNIPCWSVPDRTLICHCCPDIHTKFDHWLNIISGN